MRTDLELTEMCSNSIQLLPDYVLGRISSSFRVFVLACENGIYNSYLASLL